MVTKGRKRWIDREVVINGKSVQLKEVKRIGGGWFLPIPKVWLDWMCKADDEDRFWVEVDVNANQIIIIGHKA